MGTGHLYQGRYKSFPIEADDHFYTVCRYVERNALRAQLVSAAQDWRWGSLWRRCWEPVEHKELLSKWPVPVPAGWVRHVNRPQTEAELKVVRQSLQRGQPFGSETWARRTAAALGLESTFRPPGRPRKPAAEDGRG